MAQGLKQRRLTLLTPFPAYVNHRTAAGAETETVPAGYTAVIITPDADAWFSDGTAGVPSGDTTDGSGSFMIGAGVARGFDVSGAQTISFTPATGTVHVSFEYFA